MDGELHRYVRSTISLLGSSHEVRWCAVLPVVHVHSHSIAMYLEIMRNSTLKFLCRVIFEEDARRVAKSFGSQLQAKSAASPKLLLRHASAVYTTYSPSPQTATNLPLALCCTLAGNISELPKSCNRRTLLVSMMPCAPSSVHRRCHTE